MPETVNFGIPFCDVPPYQETWTREGGEVRRTVHVDWHHAVLFPTAMMGDAKPGGGGKIDRLIPEKHPHGSKELYCVECNLKNCHGAWINNLADNLVQFRDVVNSLPGKAEFECVYRQVPYDVLTNAQAATELSRWVSRTSHFALEVYQMPGDSYVWAKGQEVVAAAGEAVADAAGLTAAILRAFLATGSVGATAAALRAARGTTAFDDRQANKILNIPEGVPIQRPIVELKYTWHWVPEPLNEPLWQTVMGKVNAKEFDGVKGLVVYPSYERLKLLAMSYEKSDRMWTPAGHPVRDITYTLSLRPDSGWNAFYRKSSNQFEEVRERTPPGDLVYKQADFSDLFIN